MKVVIVAKTRMGSGACIGGLTFDGRSVRLIPHDAASNDRFNHEYNVGDVWDLQYQPQPDLLPPHVENVIVTDKQQLPGIDNLTAFIERHMPAREGGVDLLFDGLTQATRAGVQYIAESTGVPAYSTFFWRPDQPLLRDDDAKRIRYRYPCANDGRTLTFVGFQEPLAEIPAGTLLRVSLAHWWRPKEKPDGELRCYVQLSGWYQGQETNPWPDDPEMAPEFMQIADPPLAPAAKEDVPLTMDVAQATLDRVFGYDNFRSLQAEIVDNILQKRDSLVIMPTGSGKSLCYQLPGLMFAGLTVVVSPLISLMQDQVEQLQELGVPAVYLNSSLSYEEHLYTTAQIRAGKVKLLYIAPESLLRPETLLLLQQVKVDCLTIDEAHCISEWGHDFRPEYRQLIDVRNRLPGAVCLAATATATQRVREDIKASLSINEAGEFIASFDRENLFLAVEPRTNGLAQTIALLESHRDQSGIIYCSTRKQVDSLTDQLSSRGWPVLPYHAGLENGSRRDHQRRFRHDEGIIIVATIAFGMGINKSNVRFILHYNLPQNLEAYYQQIGRAGRDGLRANCLLLFNTADLQTIKYFISEQDPDQQIGANQRLQAMLAFCESRLCRRQPLLSYFGERYEKPSCDMCDNCQTTVVEEDLDDLTIPAQKFLSCIMRTGQYFGATHIINILRGSRSKRVLSRRHDQLPTYDIGREFSKKQWQFLARQFIQQGLLNQDLEHGSLKLTPKAYDVLKGQQFFGQLPEKETSAAWSLADVSYDKGLFDRLRAKRLELAQANHVPPYVIFSDRSLADMATYMPHSRQSFAALYGVGEAKLEKYAGEFLPIIQIYCRETGLQEKPRPVSSQVIGEKNRTKQGAEDHNEGVFKRIVRLGKSDNKENVPELIAALEDPSGNVRRLAASALGKLGDERAVQPLLDMLEKENKPQVRQYAVKALGKIGDPRAVKMLRHIAEDSSEKEYTCTAAESALRRIG